ncbi:HupE/UreJ family protein [Rhodothermus marinus]|uniref:HupE/UreJ family protein n=1 Tax=Rhodothermus marinus TaxID=29549 RepID=UPI001E0DA4D4|nr:HupE/UreJ family protein [Rhodothermus marinus]MBO2492588.1 HupE/UreJ family protein [Rhodothermus marinus]
MNRTRPVPKAAAWRWLPVLLLTTPMVALAHTGAVPPVGFGHGLLHPLTGLDHLLAALGVGLWATLQPDAPGRRLPVVFLSALLLGLPLGAAWPTPVAEIGVLGSVLLLGVALALLLRLPVIPNLVLVALFGLVHGHVHGTELLPGAGLSYVAGLLTGTALLTGAGYLTGRLLHRWQRIGALRYAGMALLLLGLLS